MDWSRAKTYLIITFLLLDLMLGYQYWKMRNEQASYVQSFPEQLAEVRELLKAQQWELATEVPRTAPEMGFLHVKYKDIPMEEWKDKIGGGHQFLYKGPGQAGLDLAERNLFVNLEEAGLGDRLFNQLGNWILMKDQYKYDQTRIEKPGTGTVTYLQSYNGYPVYSAPLEVYVQDHKVVRYNQVVLGLLGEEGTKKPVISAILALRSLSESVDKQALTPDNKVIKDIRLGYYSRSFNADEWYMTPVWRIITNKKIYFVNALTGEVEQGR